MTNVMSWDEWSNKDGLDLAGMVQSGEATPQELATQAAAAIALANPSLDGVLEVYDDAIADPFADGTNPQGPFAGIPFLLKDLGPTIAGRLQEMGSQLLQGHRAETDTFLGAQIKNAGLNIVGRTTTPEFGCCSSCENPALHVTRNPWNTDYTSCGSSAGSSAMTAAGVVPLAHGSDGGGSIRIPAGVNGLLGLKSSRGVFSLAPGASDLTSVVSIQGCMSRTVRDTAAFVDACRGAAPGEFMPFWSPEVPYLEMIRQDPKPLRIAVSHAWGPYNATAHAIAELTRVAKFLETLGHHVEFVTPPVDFETAFTAQTTCYITNFAQTVDIWLEKFGLDRPPEDKIEPINRLIWEEGKKASYDERAQMQVDFNTTSRAFGTFLADWDIILTPTIAGETPEIGTTKFLTLSDNPSVRNWFHDLWGNFAYTPLANLCGIPGLSMPLGRQQNGLPLGIQALTRQANDGMLLQLAAQIERAINGKWNGGDKPAIHVSTLAE